MIEKTKILKIFPIKEMQAFYAHVESVEWAARKNFGSVILCVKNKEIIMNYNGYGNHEGNAALQLIPNDPKYKRVEEITKIIENKDQDEELYLKREKI